LKVTRTFSIDQDIAMQFNATCRRNHEVKSQVVEDLIKVFIIENEGGHKKRGKNHEKDE